ncbi:ribonuclease R [Candidatus Azambacteria bacterium RIFCSPHIGHO2_01_FULL_44_55]|uniref:Ribonuclease R n=1 Tax=Candidatus Azambacteria bacterium RIFCSPLOWO2_02_FULL_44_14 TaxID=1797306 RepID=A0A1F5CBT6_9BACT|nr:MAG: ribonuclease R [Candidatus Azambacteria bacterium RIFCSPLOWO2_01_FULL_44_84]OGD33192.1 MAG: ribonuclease R [Candidatus Azambacteria bacterium RIFCSPHIGHO2_02_FULL_45_18]OGD40264.1 MAG: ribonuclease R [Candidatus Azambacteria bacterium RIFCSPHIGHO2_01_FULL_44_55]OGD40297.1 MAG: ribonuclease R [Candidatus Azambacteria bacterium RIFCSPLOWO2_02_FULL_44_14]
MKKEDKKSVIRGVIDITSKGTGYVTAAGFSDDIQIEPQFLNTALHGDEVEVFLFPQIEKGELSGEVIKVLYRAKVEFVGTVDKRKGNNVSFIVPDDKKMYIDILIPPVESRRIKNNWKVLARIKKWDDPKKNPEGSVLKVLGKKGDNDVEMESIVLEKGFQTGFPPKIRKEAELLEKRSKPIPQKDIAERRDFRRVTTFTIDPEDAKDFDDAVSFKNISDNLFEIGVHIADVSHYIKEGGQLDMEARQRGVSIYLVDRTIPMLPEVLSNDICSLNPGQDKLTFSAVLTISASGIIEKVWLGRTIINSNKRFTYGEAQKVLNEKSGEYCYELEHLNKLARIFKNKRMKMGALDFDREEVKFKLDAKGKPVSIVEQPRLDTHKLVEEFMILANKEVASYLSREIKRINKGASIYRIHDVPKKESIDELLFLLRMLGHEIEAKGENISSKELNDLFEKIKGKPEESLIKTVAMRSMAKAIYSIKNIGHYGLALENYTHFTSPIRRYADLLVHRILEKHLKGGNLNGQEVAWYHSLAAALSQREIDAVDAERSSIAYKQVEYMTDKIGNTYKGVISGITSWGVYVEESKTKANGMVKFKDMKDDFYVFNKETFSLVGTRSKKKYSLGDEVKIKIVGSDLERKTLDYVFV